MNTIIAATNLISALFIFVIAVGLYQVPREVLKPTRHFRYCMWLTFVGLLAEMLTCIWDGRSDMALPLTFFHYLASIIVDLMVVCYAFYLYDLISESSRDFTKRFSYFLASISTIDIIFLTIGTITGKLFTIVDGFYAAEPWHSFYGVASGICLLCIVVLYAFKYRDFRIKSKLFVVLIVTVPTLGTLILHLDHNVRYGYVVAALSMNVVFVIIQTRIIAEASADARMFSRISVKDYLTGLRNRRGYQEFIDSLKPEDTVGLAFADINSLKAVNDNQGHAAGDELIKKVARIVTVAVPTGVVCRMSGDEFVCVMVNPTQKQFDDSMSALKTILLKNDRIASLGYHMGKVSDLAAVMKTAEEMMYKDKENYYNETGKERRY
ncbi:MAG: diguanylate cyclase [Butyrivibrio sp.]|nr:diguanylate cyclase [Butyrivibrio sp.]